MNADFQAKGDSFLRLYALIIRSMRDQMRAATAGIWRVVLMTALALLTLPASAAFAEGDSTGTDFIAVPSDWSLRPSDVPVGGEFRLVFVTNSVRDSTSSDIADYDAFVQSDAASEDAHADI